MFIFKYTLLAFLCGLIAGSSFTFMFVYYQSLGVRRFWGDIKPNHEMNRKNLTNDGSKKSGIVAGRAKDYVGTTAPNATTATKLEFYRDRVDNTTAEQLYDKVRVLCWIMTSPMSLRTKAIHVRETWSKRCNIRLFMSSVEDKEFPAVGLPVKEGRDQLYEKTKKAFKYVWENYRDKADWFMKADDDTYVVLENLRFLLKDYDPNEPYYFGRKFKPFIKQGYMSGGAGYVLSKEALRRFTNGIRSGKCPKGGGVEDVEMGKCLSVMGVNSGDSRDSKARETFHPFGPIHHIIPNSIPRDNWYWKYNFYPTCSGNNCSSNYLITFHYVSKDQMYMFDFLIYDIQVYGLSHIYNKYPKLPYET